MKNYFKLLNSLPLIALASCGNNTPNINESKTYNISFTDEAIEHDMEECKAIAPILVTMEPDTLKFMNEFYNSKTSNTNWSFTIATDTRGDIEVEPKSYIRVDGEIKLNNNIKKIICVYPEEMQATIPQVSYTQHEIAVPDILKNDVKETRIRGMNGEEQIDKDIIFGGLLISTNIAIKEVRALMAIDTKNKVSNPFTENSEEHNELILNITNHINTNNSNIFINIENVNTTLNWKEESKSFAFSLSGAFDYNKPYESFNAYSIQIRLFPAVGKQLYKTESINKIITQYDNFIKYKENNMPFTRTLNAWFKTTKQFAEYNMMEDYFAQTYIQMIENYKNNNSEQLCMHLVHDIEPTEHNNIEYRYASIFTCFEKDGTPIHMKTDYLSDLRTIGLPYDFKERQ